MKRYFLVLLLVFLNLHGYSNPAVNQVWSKANSLYNQKEYDSAAFYYEKLAALKTENPEVYYNLGNTYYKLNKVGPAVLNYNRALKIDPGYTPAAENLLLTESRIHNRIPGTQDIFFVKWWKEVTNQTLSETWAIISALLFVIVILLLVLKRLNRLPFHLPSQLPAIMFILCAVTIIFAYFSSERRVKNMDAVVMFPDSPFQDNIKSAKSQSLVPEGTVVNIQAVKNGWAQITLPDGRNGWMRTEALQKI
jgi:tetratricopeptide (TPR) repeat protein